MPEKEAPLSESALKSSLAGNPSQYVHLKNPISSERTVMRQSLLASVLDVAANNLRHTDDVRFFEIGFVYMPRPGQKLPDEPRRLALVLTGQRGPGVLERSLPVKEQARTPLDFFDFKGVIEDLVERSAFAGGALSFVNGQASASGPIGHADGGGPGAGRIRRAASAHRRPVQTGRTHRPGGRARRGRLASGGAGPLWFHVRCRNSRPLCATSPWSSTSRSPPSASSARSAAAGGDLLRGVRLFDVYRGTSISAGTKSLAYALTYQAGDRTLADKEIDKAHKKIEDRLKHILKARDSGRGIVTCMMIGRRLGVWMNAE